MQIISGVVYSPSATSRPISFLFPIVFGVSLIHFSTGRRMLQPKVLSLVSVLQSLAATFVRGRMKSVNFLATEIVNSVPSESGGAKLQIFGKEKCNLIAKLSTTLVKSLPSLPLSLSLSLSLSSLSLSLSLSSSAPHAQYTSASTLGIKQIANINQSAKSSVLLRNWWSLKDNTSWSFLPCFSLSCAYVFSRWPPLSFRKSLFLGEPSCQAHLNLITINFARQKMLG